MDPHCKDALASKEALEYWSPVDWYNGGMEHTTLHLLYSRFWHKFLYDIGVVPTAEPYQKRTAHGMILGLNPHSFVNLPAEEQEKLLKEYGSQKAAEKALEEKYGEMIGCMSRSYFAFFRLMAPSQVKSFAWRALRAGMTQ